ncbi:MAG: glycoside hydrolase family 43 protein [Paludibacter sp.]|nr:glycoside hydrolase family 43 protein [Paludibacter sp.]
MKTPKYLFPKDYMADPSAHVFNGKVYIYPSHDRDSGIPENDNGDHFDMRDYHVISFDNIENGNPTDHGVILSVDDIAWAGRQLWDSDVAEKNGKYYLYFSLKDKNDVFHLGVAISDKPDGKFIPQENPIKGSYSIDPCVFAENGEYYIIFGGIWGGQLQRYRNNKALEIAAFPADNEPALCAKIARLNAAMLEFAEEPRDLVILDENGKPLMQGDTTRRFFEASWLHKYNGKYYFSYSTGDTHRLCYAVSDNIYGPYTYMGVILTPVVGWTTHHSIVKINDKWYLFHHDSVPSGGQTWLRSMKVVELEYNPDGTIKTIEGGGE